jgi:hypothetical protein
MKQRRLLNGSSENNRSAALSYETRRRDDASNERVNIERTNYEELFASS